MVYQTERGKLPCLFLTMGKVIMDCSGEFLNHIRKAKYSLCLLLLLNSKGNSLGRILFPGAWTNFSDKLLCRSGSQIYCAKVLTVNLKIAITFLSFNILE